MPKQIKEDKNVLALGDVRKDIVKEERRKKILIFPVVLIILGITLMFTGIYFDKIISILDISNLVKKIEKSNIKKNTKSNNLVLECSKESEDKTSGIKTKIQYKFTFNEEQKLKSLVEMRTISPVEYSEIGYDNIKIVNKQYTSLIKKFESVNGISVVSNMRKNELFVNIEYDYSNIDKNKIPQNEYITVNQDSNQTYKIVKKDMVTKYYSMCNEN